MRESLFSSWCKMKKIIISIVVVIIFVVSILLFNLHKIEQLKVYNPYFPSGGFIPPEFTCDGENKFPTLEVKGIPHNTKSLVIYVDDADAPTPRPFVHLMGFLPVVERIDENVLNHSILGINDFWKLGWDGPCPPKWHGIHHYYFRIFALDKKVMAQSGFTYDEFVEILNSYADNIIASGLLIGLYERK